MMHKEARMKGKLRQLGWVGLLLISFVAFTTWSQETVVPLGIIPSPPESSELEVRIWVDKGAYQIGEQVQIRYSVNKPAYIYIWDIQPDGVAVQLFPYASSTGPQTPVQPGERVLSPPPGNSAWVIAPPTGTEYLQILATTSPVNPFAFFSSDPAQFQAQIQAQILGILPASEQSWDFTSFEITDSAPPSYATLNITSSPSGASVYVDGTYVGYTPRTVFVPQGLRRVTISKPGYATWQAIYLLIGGGARTIHAPLNPLASVNTPPVASFSFNPANPAPGAWIQFDGSASSDPDGTIAGYAWDLGDGTTRSGSAVWHQYASSGSYIVTLTVTDNQGDTNTMTQAVQVGTSNQPPTAAFSYSPASPGVNAWIQFDGSASSDPDGTITSHSWTLGDGTTRSDSLVWHRFTAPGSYTVTLTVTDNDGATHSTSRIVQVGPTNQPPTAAFSYDPSNPGTNAWIQFDGSASSDPDGTIASYSWSLGDGTTRSGSVAWHQYVSSGTYTVTLTVTDNEGASHSTSKTVQVGSPQQSPVAQFTFSPPNPVVGQPVSFDATASNDPDGIIVEYRWDLDGDGVDDTFNPTTQAIYVSPGVLTIRLTVVDDDGLSSTTTQAVTVSPSGGIGGEPPMGNTPGVFVWGTDSWHLTVNAGSGWTAPRGYRLEVRSNQPFQNINQSSTVVPLGILPQPIDGGKTLVFEGTIQSGRVDYEFRVPDSSSVWMNLEYDINGDGILDTSSDFVYLRSSMVRPPVSPFVVGLPAGSSAELTPSLNFRVGSAVFYTATSQFVYWLTTISNLEAL
jgi:PKD repeat protein